MQGGYPGQMPGQMPSQMPMMPGQMPMQMPGQINQQANQHRPPTDAASRRSSISALDALARPAPPAGGMPGYGMPGAMPGYGMPGQMPGQMPGAMPGMMPGMMPPRPMMPGQMGMPPMGMQMPMTPPQMSSSINLNLTNAYLQLFRVYDEVLEKLTILNDNLPEKHYVVDQELTLYAFGDILKKPPKYETADHTTNEKDITVVICNYARPGNIVEIIKEIFPNVWINGTGHTDPSEFCATSI